MPKGLTAKAGWRKAYDNLDYTDATAIRHSTASAVHARLDHDRFTGHADVHLGRRDTSAETCFVQSETSEDLSTLRRLPTSAERKRDETSGRR